MSIIIGQLDGCIYLWLCLWTSFFRKGWGIGSGISLFIACRSYSTNTLESFQSALPAGDGGTVGIIPYIFQLGFLDASTGMFGYNLADAIFRSNQLPSIFGLCSYNYNAIDSSVYSRNEG